MPKRLIFLSGWPAVDRDGNPFAPEVSAQAAQKQRLWALEFLGEEVGALGSLRPEGINRWDQAFDHLKGMLEREREATEKDLDFLTGISDKKRKVLGSDELKRALNELGQLVADRPLEDPLRLQIDRMDRQLDNFDLHLQELHYRQHAKQHDEALGELLGKIGYASWRGESEERRMKILSELSKEQIEKLQGSGPWSPDTQGILAVLQGWGRIQELYGVEAAHTHIISGTSRASDVLALLRLTEIADADLQKTDIVPLFETGPDFENEPEILRTLLANSYYGEHLKLQGNHQVVMHGHSDGAKSVGRMQAQEEIRSVDEHASKIAHEHNIGLTLYHGRGDAARGQLPVESLFFDQSSAAHQKPSIVTIQGRRIRDLFEHEVLARNNLGKMARGILLGQHETSRPKDENHEIQEKKWREAMKAMGKLSSNTYLNLVQAHEKKFMEFFESTGILDAMAALNWGARPSKRKGELSFENMRAIPTVASTLQNRTHSLAIHGSGTALQVFSESNLPMLQEMYRGYPPFRREVDMLEASLVQADMSTKNQYAKLADNQEDARLIGDIVESEYQMAKQAVLKITGQETLFQNKPALKNSELRRNAELDSLHALQLEALSRYKEREEAEEKQKAMRIVSMTISAGAESLTVFG